MADKYFGSHELQGREETIKSSSDRSFGYVFAGVCALVAALSWYHDGRHWAWWLVAAVLFALTGWLIPHWLRPLNRLWSKLGLLLAMVISPLVLAMLFYVCVTPIGWLMRLAGKDPLRLQYEPLAQTYWIRRDPPGPAPDTLKNQF
jgi:Saxitoxin biosynthesis operon protein SxtJ